MFTPKKDMLNHSKARVLNQICCAMGGRAAEEMMIGDITSGAAGDIKMATRLSRNMVCDWGMSSLGMISLGDRQDQVFLGRELARAQNFSEETSRKVDKEIKLIIDESYDRAVKILTENKAALEKVAEALLEYETIDGKHVHEIIDTGEIQSPILKPEPPSEADEDDEDEEDAEKAKEEKDEGEGLEPGSEPAGVPA